MPLAEARALLERTGSEKRFPGSGPHFEADDPTANGNVLRTLARWCHRYTPLVSVEEAEQSECLFLEITGCAHLFGGEKPLGEHVEREFCERGLLSRVALADTAGAAWALAHYGPRENPLVVSRNQHAVALDPLPVEALRLPREVVRTLRPLDVGTIGKLRELPRQSLPCRFGDVVVRRLDQALGDAPELLTPEPPLAPLETHWTFGGPTADRSHVEAVLYELLERLVKRLPPDQGLAKLRCSLTTSDKQPVLMEVGLVRPTASLGHLRQLLGLQLERLTVSGEIAEVRLRAVVTDRLPSHQGAFFIDAENRDHPAELARLLDRLKGRLGNRSVLRPRIVNDHQPEYTARAEPVYGTLLEPREATHPPLAAHRPLRLKPKPVAIEVLSVVPEGPPVRFHLHGTEHLVLRHWGPERIETGWWRRGDVARDYYRVETGTGHQFWLFRQRRTGAWYLHGTFD